MPVESESSARPLTDRLAGTGYWAAEAARKLEDRKYSEVIRLCREHLERTPYLVSGRLMYARALLGSGQTELAREEFRRVMAVDPDNLVALKALGDATFADGDTATAMAYYGRVLEIDPECGGLQSPLRNEPREITRTVTLSRGSEDRDRSTRTITRNIPFYTETAADLYLAQGHARLAAEIFRKLHTGNRIPRLEEKLARAEARIKDKET